MVKEDKFHNKTIFFLEHPDDVAAYLEKKQDFSGSHMLIATLPEVTWELEKQNIPFTGIESFYDPHLIYAKGMENYAIVETICSSIDALFQEKNALIKKYDFRPARDNYYFLKRLFDTLTLRIQMIRTIITKEMPDRIIIFSRDGDTGTIAFQDFPFRYGERLFSIILKSGNWPFNLAEIRYLQDLSRPDPLGEKKVSSTTHISKKLKQFPLFFTPLFTAKNFGLRKAVSVFIFQCVNPVLGSKALFLLRDDPSWSSIIPELYQSGYHVKYLPEKKDILSDGQEIEERLYMRVVELLQPHCTYLSVDFLSIVESRFLSILSEYCRSLPRIIEITEKRMQSDKPVAFLCSEKSSFLEHIYAHIAQYYRVPVIAWQHGDGPFYPPMQVFVEIMDSDVHLCYGLHHQRMLKNAPHNHFDCMLESTGSLLLERMYQNTKSESGKRRILYVTTGYYYNTLYVNCYPHHDNTLWSHQKKILRMLGGQNHQVCVKLAPDPYNTRFILDFVQKSGLNSLSIIQYEKSFTELLTDADIVICDYASTPVIESIANHKTVFVLLDNPFMSEEAVALLKKRVFWSDNIDDFVVAISSFLAGKTPDRKPDETNTEYLEQCGIHNCDGKVAERVLKVLKQRTASPP